MARRFLLLTVRPEDDAAAGEYASVLAATGLAPGELAQHRLDARPLGAAIEGVDGVIVGGSPLNVTDAAKSPEQLRIEADLTRIAHVSADGGLPVMFTCYGIGVAAIALGGSVDHEHSEPVSAARVTLTAEGRLDPLFAEVGDAFDAFVGHKEAVRELPPGAVLLAGSARCPVQAFRVGRSLYATQFHPEPLAEELIERARIYQHHGYFPPDEMAVVAERIGGSSVTEPRRMLAAFVRLFG